MLKNNVFNRWKLEEVEWLMLCGWKSDAFKLLYKMAAEIEDTDVNHYGSTKNQTDRAEAI